MGTPLSFHSLSTLFPLPTSNFKKNKMSAITACNVVVAKTVQVQAKKTTTPMVSSMNSKAVVSAPSAFVSNGYKTSAMMVWQPIDNKFFETFSFLPPLSDEDIKKQIEYIV